MRKRQLMVAVLAVPFLLFAAASVFASGSSESSSAASGNKKVTVSVLWNVNSSAEKQVLNSLFAKYTKANPNVSFDLQIVPYDNYDQKLAQMTAAGTPTDVAKTTSMRPDIRPFLVDFAKKFGPDYLKNYVKSFAAGAKLGNKIIAIPLDVTATGMILNTSAFKKAGVTVPDVKTGWTYSKFLSDIKTVAQKAGVRYPLVWDVTSGRWITYLFENGQHVYSENAPYSVTLNASKAATVLDNFIKMANNYMPSGLWTGSSSENPKQLFLSGQAVAWMSGNWQVAALTKNAKFDWQAGPTPYVTNRSSVVGGDYVIAFNNAKNVAAGVKFVKWLTGPQGEAAFCAPLYYIPANINTGKVDYGNASATAALNNLQYELQVSPVYAGTDPANPAMQYVWDPLKQGILQAASGQISSLKAMESVVAAAKKGLKG